MNKFMKMGGWSTVLFMMILAGTIGARMDQHAISVLAGVASGFLVASLTVGGAAFLLGRRNQQAMDPRASQRMFAPMPQPPVNLAYAPMQYMMAPMPGMWPMQANGQTQMPNFAPGYMARPANDVLGPPMQNGRRFYVIGTTGEMQELNPLLETERAGFD